MEFRSDINALRAIAVIVVVIFHFTPDILPGGFIGVDIFFVISGFLMTKIIFTRIDEGRFSFIDFYWARAKRILPALGVMLFIVTTYCWFFLFDIEFQAFLRHLKSALLFYSNILFWQESGYFSASAHENWLLHTWSLSVEWQFYILYPVVLFTLLRIFGKIISTYLIILAALLSFSISAYATNIWPDPAYFSLPTRAWQLLAGALVFLFPISNTLSVEARNKCAIMGIGALFLCCFFITSDVGWPGIWSGLPIFATCMFLSTRVANKWAFSNNIITTNIGKWSYSIYLWHWPIVVFLNNQSFSLTFYHLLVGVVASVFMGALSYKYIEQTKLYVPKFVVYISIFCFSLFAFQYATGNDSYRSISGHPSNDIIDRYTLLRKAMDNGKNDSTCRLNAHLKADNTYALPDHCVNRENLHGVFIWGDSHAEALSKGLVEPLRSYGAVSQIYSSGCRPSVTQRVGNLSKLRRACDLANDLAVDLIEELKPSAIVFAMKDGHEKIDWHGTVKFLKDHDVKKIFIVGPTPQYYPSMSLVYVREGLGGETLSDKKLEKDLVATDLKMQNLFQDGDDVQYISIINHLCLKVEKGKLSCKVIFDNELISFDYGHLGIVGADVISQDLVLPVILND